MPDTDTATKGLSIGVGVCEGDVSDGYLIAIVVETAGGKVLSAMQIEEAEKFRDDLNSSIALALKENAKKETLQ